MNEKCPQYSQITSKDCVLPLDSFVDRTYTCNTGLVERRYEVVSGGFMIQDNQPSLCELPVSVYVVVRCTSDGSFRIVNLLELSETEDSLRYNPFRIR